MSVINDPDDHFKELFGELIAKIEAMPIMKAINGDIGLIFDTNIINSLTIGDTALKANISLELANLDQNIDIEIDYHKDDEMACFLDGIKICRMVLMRAYI